MFNSASSLIILYRLWAALGRGETEAEKMAGALPEEGEEHLKGVEAREPHVPLALILAEAARTWLSELRDRVFNRLVELNKRLSHEHIQRKTDWVGRESHVIMHVGPLGPTGEKRIVIQY